MSDPRKTFICNKCGFKINDKDRSFGKDTQCPQCMSQPKIMQSIVNVFGETLANMGEIDEIVVFDADLSHATKSSLFAAKYPKRFFNMGISEQDMISTAAGMASTGKIPFVCSFAVFVTGNAYAQIRLAAIAGLNIKIIGTHAGVKTGEDGATHQAIEDIALMRALPGMTIVQPADAIETKQAVKAMAQHKGMCYMRLCRGSLHDIHDKDYVFNLNKAEIIREGTDITIIATGALVYETIQAAGLLATKGINAEVINISTIKPLDYTLISESIQKTRKVLVCEDHNVIGGLGSAIEEVVCQRVPCQIDKIGINDVFGESGGADDLYKKHGITSKGIAAGAAIKFGILF